MNVIFSNRYCAPYTEAHKEGCKAATRRYMKVETETRLVPLETLVAMRKNPDEGHVKIHACLKPILEEAENGKA